MIKIRVVAASIAAMSIACDGLSTSVEGEEGDLDDLESKLGEVDLGSLSDVVPEWSAKPLE